MKKEDFLQLDVSALATAVVSVINKHHIDKLALALRKSGANYTSRYARFLVLGRAAELAPLQLALACQQNLRDVTDADVLALICAFLDKGTSSLYSLNIMFLTDVCVCCLGVDLSAEEVWLVRSKLVVGFKELLGLLKHKIRLPAHNEDIAVEAAAERNVSPLSHVLSFIAAPQHAASTASAIFAIVRPVAFSEPGVRLPANWSGSLDGTANLRFGNFSPIEKSLAADDDVEKTPDFSVYFNARASLS